MIWKLIPKKLIVYAVAAMILLAVGAFGGYTFCKRSQYKGIIKQQQKDAKAVVKHQEKKDVVDEKVGNALEEAKKVSDASGCLDKPSPDVYLDRLLRADSVAESGFD